MKYDITYITPMTATVTLEEPIRSREDIGAVTNLIAKKIGKPVEVQAWEAVEEPTETPETPETPENPESTEEPTGTPESPEES